MIVYGKVTHSIFDSNDGNFHIFNILVHGGKPLVATYVGDDTPKPLKTVEYEFRGEEVTHPKYGKQLSVTSYGRSTVKGETRSLNRHLKKYADASTKHMNDL